MLNVAGTTEIIVKIDDVRAVGYVLNCGQFSNWAVQTSEYKHGWIFDRSTMITPSLRSNGKNHG